MPLFDYYCTDCGSTFEVMCKISERNELHSCPKCASESTSQVILSSPALAQSHRLGVNTRQKEFREVLNKIHKRTPGSTLNKTADLG